MNNCPKCGNVHFVKNGKRKIKNNLIQGYLCKDCHYQFTDNSKQKNALKNIKMAITLYNKGLSLRIIAKLFNLNSASTVYYWIGKYQDVSINYSNKVIINFLIKSKILYNITIKQQNCLMKFVSKLKTEQK